MQSKKKLFTYRGYPFGKRRYIIATGKNIKKALSIEEVKLIFKYEVVPPMEKAKEFWIFSYVCNGINMMDLAQLKQKDVHSTCIAFIWQKTKGTTKGNPITITIL